jgi:hypothetical protein
VTNKFPINMGPILNGCGATGIFLILVNSPVNCASQATLRDLEPAGG